MIVQELPQCSSDFLYSVYVPFYIYIKILIINVSYQTTSTQLNSSNHGRVARKNWANPDYGTAIRQILKGTRALSLSGLKGSYQEPADKTNWTLILSLSFYYFLKDNSKFFKQKSILIWEIFLFSCNQTGHTIPDPVGGHDDAVKNWSTAPWH